jgi:nucleoside-diphosphate-sugar epimerase
MMRIAILGATSQIAKDLVHSFSAQDNFHLHLFARFPDKIKKWLTHTGLLDPIPVEDFSRFSRGKFDVIINFVGVGNPEKAMAMGAAVYDTTIKYDEIALDYVRQNPECRYIFLSSGAAYGSRFTEPATCDTPAVVAINNLTPQDWYGVAKLHAECRHRAYPHLSIIDIRVFNYFSRTQDLSPRFLITDILRAIRDKVVLKTSTDFIMRDYLHPSDFHALIVALLSAPSVNTVVDCYSRAPIDKQTLLATMKEIFRLQYELAETFDSINATGIKPCYYSLNRRASEFGYRPRLTSLEGILQESAAILQSDII